MKQVDFIGRFRVHRHNSRWIVVRVNDHAEACISSHGSHATAVAAAKRYDETDRQRRARFRNLVRRFV